MGINIKYLVIVLAFSASCVYGADHLPFNCSTSPDETAGILRSAAIMQDTYPEIRQVSNQVPKSFNHLNLPERLNKDSIGKSLYAPRFTLRHCYEKALMTSPDPQTVTILFEAKNGAMIIKLVRSTGSDSTLSSCIRDTLPKDVKFPEHIAGQFEWTLPFLNNR